jgi:hypothetical protein
VVLFAGSCISSLLIFHILRYRLLLQRGGDDISLDAPEALDEAPLVGAIEWTVSKQRVS